MTSFKAMRAPLSPVMLPWRVANLQPADGPPSPLPRSVMHAMHSQPPGGCNMGAYSVDILAVGFFLLEWTVYAVTLEHTAYGRNSLSARMHAYREIWIRRLLAR